MQELGKMEISEVGIMACICEEPLLVLSIDEDIAKEDSDLIEDKLELGGLSRREEEAEATSGYEYVICYLR